MDAWETPEQVAHREATADKAKLHITEAQDLAPGSPGWTPPRSLREVMPP